MAHRVVTQIMQLTLKTPALRIYRASSLELKEQLESYFRAGYIEQAKSPLEAGALFAYKKGGTLRMYIDHRALNKFTIKDKYLCRGLSSGLRAVFTTVWLTALT